MFPAGTGAVLPLDNDLSGHAAHTRAVARLDEDSVADQLLEAALLNAEETAHLVGGEHGDINTGHERKTTPFMRRTEVGTSDNFAKTPIESSK